MLCPWVPPLDLYCSYLHLLLVWVFLHSLLYMIMEEHGLLGWDKAIDHHIDCLIYNPLWWSTEAKLINLDLLKQRPLFLLLQNIYFSVKTLIIYCRNIVGSGDQAWDQSWHCFWWWRWWSLLNSRCLVGSNKVRRKFVFSESFLTLTFLAFI